MTFLDLAGELLAKVDFKQSKIVLPQKLVFVCGGKKSNNSLSPTSMREILLTKAADAGNVGGLGDAQVLLAEVAVSALSGSSFTDLLELEKYIAAIAQAVVLIVESPGSMCELGAFIMVPEISSKLVVVLQGEYMDVPSFITDGAIKYFKSHQSDAQVHGYDWHINNMTKAITVPDYVTDAMLREIPAAIQEVHTAHAKERFKKDNLGHLIYLTLSFCHLLRAAKMIDIKRCFEFSNIFIEEINIKHCLDTLRICKMIKMVPQARLEYYIYTYDARTRKSFGSRMRKLSVIRDENRLKCFGTVSLRNVMIASAKSLNAA